MKRTFGKILSFALVLAMVLSMVPAVLAAPKAGDAQYLALGETANLTCTGAEYWVSSNPSAVSVTKTATGSATITSPALPLGPVTVALSVRLAPGSSAALVLLP